MPIPSQCEGDKQNEDKGSIRETRGNENEWQYGGDKRSVKETRGVRERQVVGGSYDEANLSVRVKGECGRQGGYDGQRGEYGREYMGD